MDYNGFNLRDQLQPKGGAISSAEECCAECQKHSECSHFTFIWKTCWLKSSANGRKVSASGVSGTCIRHPSSTETCRLRTLLPQEERLGVEYAPLSWDFYPTMPTSLSEVAASIVNGNTLVVVGDGDTQQGSAATYAYSLVEAEWSLLAPRPFKGSHHASAAIGDDFYLFGGLGYGSQSTVQVYNIVANKWTIRPSSEMIPYGQMIGAASAVLLNTEIFVCGGLEMAAGFEASVAACAAYTPPTMDSSQKQGAWRPVAPMLGPVNHHAAGTDGSRMYIFGGRNNNANVPADGIRNMQIYDPATDLWTAGPMMPFGRSGMGAAPYLDGRFYIFGGEETIQTFSDSNGVFGQTEVYNTLTEDWEEGPAMLQASHGIYPVADPFESKIYVVGGGVNVGLSASATFQTLSVPTSSRLTASNSVLETVACAVLRADDAAATLSCNAGGIVSEVMFAAKGHGATGRCGTYSKAADTAAGESDEIVEGICAIDVSNDIRDSCLGQPACQLVAADFSQHACHGPVVVQVKCTVPSLGDEVAVGSGDGETLQFKESDAFSMCTASVAPVLDHQAGIE